MSFVIVYSHIHHALQPLFQALADEGIVREAMGNQNFKVTATIAPMVITKREDEYAQAIDAFNLWILVVW